MEVHITPGLTFLVGRAGSGKSTWLRRIKQALTVQYRSVWWVDLECGLPIPVEDGVMVYTPDEYLSAADVRAFQRKAPESVILIDQAGFQMVQGPLLPHLQDLHAAAMSCGMPIIATIQAPRGTLPGLEQHFDRVINLGDFPLDKADEAVTIHV
jgi:energy-coupling factor transporter ATP-binding protein EcfA2